MAIAADKTDVLVIKPSKKHKDVEERIIMNGKELKKVKKKKILGVIVDNELSFKEHVDGRTKSGFKALSGISHFGNEKFGCSQDTFIRLYKSLVLPVMEYGIVAAATASQYACKEFDKVQRKAMVSATGCVAKTAV